MHTHLKELKGVKLALTAIHHFVITNPRFMGAAN